MGCQQSAPMAATDPTNTHTTTTKTVPPVPAIPTTTVATTTTTGTSTPATTNTTPTATTTGTADNVTMAPTHLPPPNYLPDDITTTKIECIGGFHYHLYKLSSVLQHIVQKGVTDATLCCIQQEGTVTCSEISVHDRSI